MRKGRVQNLDAVVSVNAIVNEIGSVGQVLPGEGQVLTKELNTLI